MTIWSLEPCIDSIILCRGSLDAGVDMIRMTARAIVFGCCLTQIMVLP